METEKKETLNIVYGKDPEYRIVPATGAYGGPTPQGEMLCHFYVEYKEPPESEKIEVSRSGTGKTISSVQKDEYLRQLNVGIIMRPDIAISVGKFLIEQAEKILSHKGSLRKEES